MEQPWRIIAAAALIAVLIAGIAWSALGGNDAARSEAGPSTAATAVPPSSSMPASTTTAATTTMSAAPSTLPSTTPTPSTTTASTATEATVLEATAGALVAWGRFAVSGDWSVVAGHFAAHGPQYEQLRREAAVLAATPLGSPAYAFEVRDPTVTVEGSDRATVAGRLVMTRPGEPDQAFDWIIYLRLIDGRWQLWTVVEAGE